MDQEAAVQQMSAAIEQDWEVIGSDGQLIGHVNEVHTNYIWVQKGLLFPTDMYIPDTAFDRMEPGRVFLTVTAVEVVAAGWETLPEAITANSVIPGTVEAGAAGATA
jgi:hypothetical protein